MLKNPHRLEAILKQRYKVNKADWTKATAGSYRPLLQRAPTIET